jgi:16S rRNA U516 pseudouridylate synthase RsuA-like enzyme
MLAAVGHPVRRLHRTTYAGLTLDGLEPGAWRELEHSDVARLKQTVGAGGEGGGAGSARPS